MPQVIITKYLPATNTRGSRIKAYCERGSITISYPHELSGDAVHIAAANALVAKFVKADESRGEMNSPWKGPRVVGGIAKGMCAHVFSDFNNNVVIGCANQEDAQRLVSTVNQCKPDGQISQLAKGLLGSMFKRASI